MDLGRCTRSSMFVLAGVVSTTVALGNPCPPPPVGGAPPYLPIMGTVVSGGDTINAGPLEACLILGGTLEMTGVLTNNGQLSIGPPGGTFRLDGGGGTLMNFGIYTTSSGVSANGLPLPGSGLVDNHGSIVNAGRFASAGQFVSSGSITNIAGASFALETDSSSRSDIVNQGDFLVTGALFAATLTNTGSIQNEAGGTFEVLFGAGVLANSGSVDTAGAFHLTGVLNNQAGGTFANSGSLTSLGTIQTAAASTFTNTGALLSNGAFNHGGTLNNNSGGSFTSSGNFSNLGGTVNNANGGTVFTNSGVFSNEPGGLVNNVDAASFVNQGLLTNRGVISNAGEFSVQGAAANVDNQGVVNNVDGTITIDAVAAWHNSGTLANSTDQIQGATGTFQAGGAIFNTGQGLIVNHPGGMFTLLSGATLSNQGTARIDNRAGGLFDIRGQVTNDGAFDNAGTVQLTGSIGGGGTYTQTAGLTKLFGGTLDQALIDIRGGSLLGAGTLRGAVRVAAGAMIGPGDPNLTTIDGSLLLAGTLVLQIAGAADFDRLLVTGSADLTGSHVVFDFIGGYAPLPGTSFADIVHATLGFTGLASAQFEFLDVDPALGLQVVAGADGLALVAGVPEPSSALMLAAGLLLVLGAAASNQRGPIRFRSPG
jgi:hypothetical protein